MDAERYRFGVFELDAANGELRREGTVVRLQAQPAQVLACLVKSAGQVVSRKELCTAVWGTETFVDFERGLNFCVAQIRSALDDDSATPRYVRTIPKRGYQFVAPVERLMERAELTEARREGERKRELQLGFSYWRRSRLDWATACCPRTARPGRPGRPARPS